MQYSDAIRAAHERLEIAVRAINRGEDVHAEIGQILYEIDRLRERAIGWTGEPISEG